MTEVGKKSKFREILNLASTIVSWTIFVLLIICAIFLSYYFVATRIYMAKGSGYEPKFSLYTIISPSMTPNIKVYDVVVDLKVNNPEDIGINDVITFNSDNPELKGGTITHRVIAVTKDSDGKYFYQTKGDANLAEDSSLVPYSKIVGKVALKIPQLGRVQFFLASSFGWLLIVVIPALYIIIKDILKILKLTKEDKEEKKFDLQAELADIINQDDSFNNVIEEHSEIESTKPVENQISSIEFSELERNFEAVEQHDGENNVIHGSKNIDTSSSLSNIISDNDDIDIDDLPSLK